MPVFFYDIFLLLYRAAAFIGSLFNNKTKKWQQGRKGIFEKLRTTIPADAKIVWMHCSSLGEFEQGRPVLEKIRLQYPQHKLLLTFFSPSGYEVQKEYAGADWIFYLPMDGRANAKKFIETVRPLLVIFVKYDFWYYYLKKIKYSNIPLILVSALFRKKMPFFKWYGRLQRKMLSRFNHLFVQNEASKKLIDNIGLANICTVSGDTRFDRVIEIAEQWKPIPGIEEFIDGNKAIIAGSTWTEDEEVLQKALALINNPSLKLIIAPHELGEKNLITTEKLFPDSIRYSQLPAQNSKAVSCLIIDNIGMLSRLYKYGTIAYVGGGMTSYGVHNVLEAAVYSKPVIFGPHYKKYIEARGLVIRSGGIVVRNEKELARDIAYLLNNTDNAYTVCSAAAGNFVRENAGATNKIMHYIQENRLLTN